MRLLKRSGGVFKSKISTEKTEKGVQRENFGF
jgi:hypothetical protein